MKYDLPALHEFLQHTPEGGLRKMLVDPKSFSDIHFNMMLKIVRVCNAEQFSQHCEKEDFPKIKFSPNEIKTKETFWKSLLAICDSRGLLSPATETKAA